MADAVPGWLKVAGAALGVGLSATAFLNLGVDVCRWIFDAEIKHAKTEEIDAIVKPRIEALEKNAEAFGRYTRSKEAEEDAQIVENFRLCNQGELPEAWCAKFYRRYDLYNDVSDVAGGPPE